MTEPNATHDSHTADPTPDLPTGRRALLAGIGGLTAGAFLAGNRPAHAGPLNPPPGPIAPTGRTTDEIFNQVATEGRRGWTPVGPDTTPGVPGDSTYSITRPGNYYLTGSVDNADNVSAITIGSDVRLHLNGFLVSASGVGRFGVRVLASRVNVEVRGGYILAIGGAIALNLSPDGGLAEDLFIEANNSAIGIQLDRARATVVRNVLLWSQQGQGTAVAHGPFALNITLDRVRVCGSSNWASGIAVPAQSELRHCFVNQVSGAGITTGESCTLRDCTVNANFSGNAINAGSRSTITDCVVDRSGGIGINTGFQCLVERCRSTTNGVGGFQVGDSSVIRNCYADLHLTVGQFGIKANGNTVQVLDNSIQRCAIGIDFRNVGGCVAFRNICRSCPTGVAVNAGGNWYPFVDFSNVNSATNPLANLFT